MIEKYKQHRRIGVLKKQGSPISILFCTNDLPNMWLIDSIRFKNNSSQIVEDSFILNKDFPKVLNYWRSKGYTGLIRTRFNISGKIVSLKDKWEYGELLNKDNCQSHEIIATHYGMC